MFVVRRVIAVAAGVAALVVLTVLPLSASEATVTATVTPQNISLSLNLTNINYGNVGFGAVKEFENTIVVTNTGSGTQAFHVYGTNATGATPNWSLNEASIATNQFRHSVRGITGGNGVVIAEKFLTTAQQTWADKVAAATDQARRSTSGRRSTCPLLAVAELVKR